MRPGVRAAATLGAGAPATRRGAGEGSGGAAPADKWSVAKLAKVASLSPFHLCRVFRQMVGISIYDYVLQERLAHSLDAVLDGGDDLTAIALDGGFASHSHFTARFRSFFGVTPTALRRIATAGHIAELRKIMTARRRLACLRRRLRERQEGPWILRLFMQAAATPR